MEQEVSLAIGVAVVPTVQLIKWAGAGRFDRFGPLIVISTSLAGVLFWAWTHDALLKSQAWDLAMTTVSVTVTAAGIFGFTRASGDAVSTLKAPPRDGAGSTHTAPSHTEE